MASVLGEQAQADGDNQTSKVAIRVSEKTEFAVGNGTASLVLTSTSSDLGRMKPSGNVTCGNGVREGAGPAKEQCDDGNLVDGDGCSKLCKVEGGFACEPKLLTGKGDKCYVCKESQCTILFNKSFRCLNTKHSKGKKNLQPPTHVRDGSGFCKCAQNHCISISGGDCLAAGRNGWVENLETGKCECGLGHCLMPYGKQTIESPTKYHCMKLNKAMVRNFNTTKCECAKGSPAVISDDPSTAKRLTFSACKVYPTTPIKRMPHQGPIFPEFACQVEPYVKGNASDLCTDCTNTSCKMERPGVSFSSRNLGAQNKTMQFYCASKQTMKQMQLTRDANGMCLCKKDECLQPYRDSFKCVPIDGQGPFGSIKLQNGKCGCSMTADTCIMPTSPSGFGKPGKGFQCLQLKEGGVKTRYGKRYFRAPSGYCACVPTKCRADPKPSSVGNFRCVDVEKNGAYEHDKEELAAVKAGTSSKPDIKCRCAPGSCEVPGDTSHTPGCITCPTIPGQCKSRCTADGVLSANSTQCVKYCSTKHVKKMPAPGFGYGDLFDKRNFIARVIRCFVAKKVKCEKAKDGKRRKCSQAVTARVIYDCPGMRSMRSNRKLMDGTETHGFKSVCSRQNLECQKAKCDPSASAAVCFEKMLLS
jgi:cysteine-rich repeat protein